MLDSVWSWVDTTRHLNHKWTCFATRQVGDYNVKRTFFLRCGSWKRQVKVLLTATHIWYLQYMSFRDRTSKCDIEDIHSAYQQPRGCYVDTKAKWTAWGCPVTATWRIFSLGTWTAVEHNFMLLLFCYSFIKFNLFLWVLGNKPQWIVWYIWSPTISNVVFIYFLLEFISQLVFVCILSCLCSIKRCSLESNCNLYKLANNIKE